MKIENLFSVRSKNIVITGGSSGIGRMMAEGFCANGANVVIASRNFDQCHIAAQRINAAYPEGQCVPFQCDVANPAHIEQFANFLAKHFANLDVLINNAGKTWGAPFDSFPLHAWQSVLDVNVSAPFLLVQQLKEQLLKSASMESPGRIINIGSVVGIRPITNHAFSYGASKAAIHHLTRMLANEFAPHHITVNALAPGAFPSRMMAKETESDVARQAILDQTPLRRLGQADDIISAAIFLSSAAGAFITGAIVPVDGGMAVSV
ncbi:MAG: SDR family oxidoreductase [Parasphingorhabdus sp.]